MFSFAPAWLAKLDELRAAGVHPYPNGLAVTHTSTELHKRFEGVEDPEASEPDIDVRIGIHTGEVVAGVIGVEKFAYDLWGDTVNLASRMESHGIPGEIQLSEATRDRLGGAFRGRERGQIPIKGKGTLRVFLLDEVA